MIIWDLLKPKVHFTTNPQYPAKMLIANIKTSLVAPGKNTNISIWPARFSNLSNGFRLPESAAYFPSGKKAVNPLCKGLNGQLPATIFMHTS